MTTDHGRDGPTVGGERLDGGARGVWREGQDGRERPYVDHGIGRAREEEVGRGIHGDAGDGLEVGRRRRDEAAGADLAGV